MQSYWLLEQVVRKVTTVFKALILMHFIEKHRHLYTCEISGFHGGEYDVQNCLLGCTAV
jgi:hypothetical protein